MINLKGKSLADIQAMIAELQAAENAVREQETAKVEALAKYENEKFAWAEACVKLLKGVTALTFEAVFTELPPKPKKPAVLSATKVRTTKVKVDGRPTKKDFFNGIQYPIKRTDLEEKFHEIFPEDDAPTIVRNYCKAGEQKGYIVRR
jgi:hypothetical protein